MFTPGRSYFVTVYVNAVESSHNYRATCLEVAMPLVRFQVEDGGETIVNVHSAAFVGAKLAED